LIVLAASDDDKCLAALDSVYKKCGLDNFDSCRRFIDKITQGRPELKEKLIKETDWVESFYRKEYTGHLTEDSPCPDHSYKHAFGEGVQDRNIIKEEQMCCDCNRIHVWMQNMIAATSSITMLDEEDADTIETLQYYLQNTLFVELETYIGHIVRKAHESGVDRILLDALGDDEVYIRCDWKMKQLAMFFRESMVQFYGKRGFAHFGFMCGWRKTEEEKAVERLITGESYVSELHTQFYDLLCNDSSEDSFLTVNMIEIALKELKKKVPRLIKASVVTDGAGCFSGTNFCHALGYMGQKTGIRVLVHIVTEAGCGKSPLDAHFCYVRKHLIRMVTQGRGQQDVSNAEDCTKALSRGGGLASAKAGFVTISRELEPEKDGGSYPGLDAHLYRKYIYIGEDVREIFTKIELYRMSMRENVEPNAVVTKEEFLELRDPPVLCIGTCVYYTDLGERNIIVVKKAVQLTSTTKDKGKRYDMNRGVKKMAKSKLIEENLNNDIIQTEIMIQSSKRKSVHKDLAVRKRRKSIKDILIEVVRKGLLTVKQTYCSSAAIRPLLEGLVSYDKVSQILIDGTAYKVTLQNKGFAKKKNSKNTHINSDQMKFIVWAQGLGDPEVTEKGTKIMPQDAADAMRFKGTIAGELKYPLEDYMKASTHGSAFFKMSLLLTAAQLKSYTSKPRAALILQQDNLIIKERKNKEQLVLDDLAAAEKLRFERDEPDSYLVKSMNCKDIKERLKKEFKCKLTIPSETGGKPVNMKMQQLSELLIEKLKEKRINDSINRIAVDNNVI
jgi:hypothetical protein